MLTEKRKHKHSFRRKQNDFMTMTHDWLSWCQPNWTPEYISFSQALLGIKPFSFHKLYLEAFIMKKRPDCEVTLCFPFNLQL